MVFGIFSNSGILPNTLVAAFSEVLIVPIFWPFLYKSLLWVE